MKLYEGMFVIDAARVARDWEETRLSVTSVLEKHGASMEKGWRFDERKLAYPIKKVRRGVYLLQYFTADPEAIEEMRVDLNLSESVLRYMILRVEGDEAPETPTLGTATPVPADTAIPSREEPKAEEPKAEEPKAEEPKAEEPKAEEPKAEEPKAEEETPAEEPKAEEAPAEEPKAEEAPAEEPAAEAAPAEEAPAEEPAAEEPAEEKKEEA